MSYRACALAAALITALPATASATKRMTAIRAERAPTLDGRLDDAVWQRAHFVSDFLQADPNPGAPPSRRTDVAIAFDGHYLYVGARMHAAGPDDVRTVMTRRDDSGSAERIIVSFDPFLDRRTAYSFAVTAAGVRVDWYHPDDNAYSRDHSYNPVWEAKTHVDADGWTAEMRIPFSQLRFPEREVHTWGVNLNRYMPQDAEDAFWIVVPKNTVAWSSQFGELVGLERLAPTRRLELTPYVAGDVTYTSAAAIDPDDPFADELDLAGRGGVDLKMGLGPSLTLDATLNPDFGQVEADPAVVNLSAFEPQLAERRPFFVEGSQLLSGLGPTYFYSRRIGGPPHGEPAADYYDAPAATRILGAAKVTGRLRSGLSVGALTALTQRTHADTYDAATGTRDRALVDPLTAYGVLRVQQELGRNSSIVGLSFANAYRRLDASDPLAGQLTRQAYVGGADWRLRFGDGGVYELRGHLGGSVINGEAEAIAAVQTSSAHYFQRPDQDHVALDPTRRTMAGWTAALGGGKRSGRWRWNAALGTESPDYEPNDTGMLYSADDIWLDAGMSYNESTPSDAYRGYDLGLWFWDEINFAGVRKPGLARAHGGITLPNYIRIGGRVEWLFPGRSDDATRGGPLMGIGTGGVAALDVANHFSGARLRWSASLLYQFHDTGDNGVRAYAGLTVLPSDQLQLSLSPRLVRVERNRQYIDTLPGGRPETFDQSYVFGTVTLSEIAAQLRAQLAVTPNLSLELYAEPFASSGEYTSFGELAAPGSRELLPYDYGDNVDFTVLSLRSTFVLRWELLPGSTLYAVWQQNRGNELITGDPVGLGALGDTVDAPGSHTLALKLSYWWPVD